MALHRRPARPAPSRAHTLTSTLFFSLLALVAILALCPVAVGADEDKKSEFGTVIGIGEQDPFVSTRPPC